MQKNTRFWVFFCVMYLLKMFRLVGVLFLFVKVELEIMMTTCACAV